MAALVVAGVCAPPRYETLTLLEREALINAVRAGRR